MTFLQEETSAQKAIKTLLADNPAILNFMYNYNLTKMNMAPKKIRKAMKSASSGEQVMANLALDYWDNLGKTKVIDVLHCLDHARFHNFIHSMIAFRVAGNIDNLISMIQDYYNEEVTKNDANQNQ